MGFLAPAIPWIIQGVGALAGGYFGKQAQNAAQQRSPEELAALSGANKAATGLSTQGQTLSNMGLPAAQSSLNYYGTLLSGSRGAMSMATAGPRASITDTYSGAAKNLEESGVRGAGRDQAVATLAREKASQIAGLTAGVQPGAASALLSGGTNLIGQGNQAMSGAANIYSSLLGQGFNNRVYARDQGQQAGSSIGSFLFDMLRGTVGKKTGGAGQLYPTGQGDTPPGFIGG